MRGMAHIHIAFACDMYVILQLLLQQRREALFQELHAQLPAEYQTLLQSSCNAVFVARPPQVFYVDTPLLGVSRPLVSVCRALLIVYRAFLVYVGLF